MITRLSVAVAVAALTVFPGSAQAAPPSLQVSDVVGIWKRCFEPALENVNEVDAGYLVLMPDGRFFELAEGCCREGHEPPPQPRTGTFSVSGDRIRLHEPGGGAGARVVEHRVTREREVVFFDDLDGDPVRTLVLHPNGDVNYGYGKAFWREGWWKTETGLGAPP